jgi:hypothetical protein
VEKGDIQYVVPVREIKKIHRILVGKTVEKGDIQYVVPVREIRRSTEF